MTKAEGQNAAPYSADQILLDAEALNRFLAELFPHATAHRRGVVTEAKPGFVAMKMDVNEKALRPGGLVSGPTQMGFADVAAFALVLAHIGFQPMAVTTGLNYQFLRPCLPDRLRATAELLRLGRKLAVIDVRLYSGDDVRPVGQAAVTYAMP